LLFVLGRYSQKSSLNIFKWAWRIWF